MGQLTEGLAMVDPLTNDSLVLMSAFRPSPPPPPVKTRSAGSTRSQTVRGQHVLFRAATAHSCENTPSRPLHQSESYPSIVPTSNCSLADLSRSRAGLAP